MNSWLDKGCFLIVLYTLLYIFNSGRVPQWNELYAGAFAIVLVGIGIEVYKKVKTNA
jgi:hypothetical protein